MNTDALSSPSGLSLPLEIHAATRHAHTYLNRLITARLPLCLPPCVTSPIAYALGMEIFGQIFLTFEESWESFRESPIQERDRRIQEILLHAYIPSLSRTPRLRHDLAVLENIPGETFEGSVQADSHDLKCHIQTQIQESITRKPHVTLAYVWVMYMALFNGGRWIRTQLQNAGYHFWQETRPRDAVCIGRLAEVEALSFWEFDGPSDGEDIKDDLKKRFNAAADILTPSERDDVVKESERIFDICKGLVHWLDDHARTDTSMDNHISSPSRTFPGWFHYLLPIMAISTFWTWILTAVQSPGRFHLRPLWQKELHAN